MGFSSMVSSQLTAKKRRLSLSLMVMLLLHWTFSSCVALADTLCLEPDGVVSWEQSDEPCHSALNGKDKTCVDFQAHDGHDDHASIYAKLQLPDTSAVLPPTYDSSEHLRAVRTKLQKPQATGPPVKPFSIIIRETSYLHI